MGTEGSCGTGAIIQQLPAVPQPLGVEVEKAEHHPLYLTGYQKEGHSSPPPKL